MTGSLPPIMSYPLISLCLISIFRGATAVLPPTPPSVALTSTNVSATPLSTTAPPSTDPVSVPPIPGPTHSSCFKFLEQQDACVYRSSTNNCNAKKTSIQIQQFGFDQDTLKPSSGGTAATGVLLPSPVPVIAPILAPTPASLSGTVAANPAPATAPLSTTAPVSGNPTASLSITAPVSGNATASLSTTAPVSGNATASLSTTAPVSGNKTASPLTTAPVLPSKSAPVTADPNHTEPDLDSSADESIPDLIQKKIKRRSPATGQAVPGNSSIITPTPSAQTLPTPPVTGAGSNATAVKPATTLPAVAGSALGICGPYDAEAEIGVCLYSGSDANGLNTSSGGWLSSSFNSNCGKEVALLRNGMTKPVIARVIDGCNFLITQNAIGCSQLYLTKKAFLALNPTPSEIDAGVLSDSVVWDFYAVTNTSNVPL